LNYTRVGNQRNRRGLPLLRLGRGILSTVPHIVDPGPAQRAHLRLLRQQLEATTDEAEQERIKAEIAELEHSMGRGGGLFRRLLLGWGRRSVPW
jgi:hypothetical protein